MKRAGGLWPEICSFENLVRATALAARGKRDREEIGLFLLDLEPQLLRLQRELRAGIWRPGPYRVFQIREPKLRRICAAPFPDRVVHHALCDVTGPVLERGYVFDSYACRPGKGSHRAVRRAQDFARRFRYSLKLDISQYFASVDHAVVKGRLARRVREREVLDLFGRIIDHGEPEAQAGVGLPIGNLTSQHLANLYLDAADHLIREELRVPGYIRYMDDMLLFADSRPALWDALRLLEAFLERELCLRIKPGSVRLAPCGQGIPFLGFRVFPGTIRVLRAAWRRFVKKLGERERQYAAGEIDESAREASVRSMVEFLRLGDTRNLRRAALELGPRGV